MLTITRGGAVRPLPFELAVNLGSAMKRLKESDLVHNSNR
ncbi:hypothetical protein L195_g061994, partial [Trifolium pratense]